MKTDKQLSGGWRAGVAAGIMAPAIIAFGMPVGTGGAPTEHYYKQRGARGYTYVRYETIPSNGVAEGQRTAAGDLARVRDILKPAVSDLATLFGVSRQAIYNWQAGEHPTSEHAAKLEDLAKAADVIAAEGLRQPGQLLKRKISNGQNLLDIVRQGASASEAAQKLVQIVRREEQQRKLLANRFAGRKQPIGQYGDYGVPLLNEQG